MLYLTDQPDSTAAFLPPGAAWQPAAAGPVPEDAARWSRLFGTGGAFWHCAVDDLPDAVFPDRRVVLIDRAARSQFDAAWGHLQQGGDLPDGLVCLALEGTGFRGQRDRTWTVLRGNLHVTAHYEIDRPAAWLGAGLTMWPVVAAVQAVIDASEGRVVPDIKWINDVCLRGGKLGGVLTATRLRGERVERALVGIGINVARAPALSPTLFVPATACLEGCGVGLPGLLAALVSRLDRDGCALRTVGPEPLFRAYRDRSGFIGRAVRIWPAHSADGRDTAPLGSGRVLELLPDLSLRIEGCPDPVRDGRMAYATECVGS
jgi:BirA family transcriptional regulator, biotin operon repressor / biotin---[acetyl-CoA-carboxylase] ligase